MQGLRLSDVSFGYRSGVALFAGVSVHLTGGWYGLVGPNGCGKSTWLRLVSGDLAPTTGHVRLVPPGAEVVQCPQEVEARGPEIVSLAGRRDGLARRLTGQFALAPDGPERWAQLSPGERRRWQIAAALAVEPAVLLLDEPTNHLDATARAQLVSALRRFEGVGIVVSHDRGLLDQLTAQTLWIHDRQVELLAAPYSEARRLRQEAAARAGAERDRLVQQRDRAARHLHDQRRQHEATKHSARTSHRMRNRYDSDARGALAQTRAAWAEDRAGRSVAVSRAALSRAAAQLPSGERDATLGRSVFVDYQPPPRERLLTLEDSLVRAGERALLRDVRVELRRRDRIWLRGDNGAGKTTLLHALLARSALPPDRLLWLPQELPPDAVQAMMQEVRVLTPVERGRVLSLVAALGCPPSPCWPPITPRRARRASWPSPSAWAATSGRWSWTSRPTTSTYLPSNASRRRWPATPAPSCWSPTTSTWPRAAPPGSGPSRTGSWTPARDPGSAAV